jgi:hypothetical protein
MSLREHFPQSDSRKVFSMSLLPKSLARAFGFASDLRHWQAVRQMMEREISPIILHFPITGGNPLAFFENHVLLWDGSSTRDRFFGTKTIDEAIEPIGTGRTAPDAICDLFDQLSTLSPEVSIYKTTSSGRGFNAVSFQFEKGLFKKQPGEISYKYDLPKREKQIIAALGEISDLRPSRP